MRDHLLEESVVIETVRALEAADQPLNPREWGALEDRGLREAVNQRLLGLGRQLIGVTDSDSGPVTGYLSGWSDHAAEVLRDDPAGLTSEDLAVLTLVFLHTTVLVGILGEQAAPLHEQLNAHRGPDGRDIISADRLRESLGRLRSRQLLDGRYRPGPALARLSPGQRRRLEENLVLLVRPDSVWAREIRDGRRQEARLGGDG